MTALTRRDFLGSAALTRVASVIAVVWRGTAQAEVLPSVDVSTREARMREAVRRILERFPPKAQEAHRRGS